MEEKIKNECCDDQKWHKGHKAHQASHGCVYFLTFIGAAIYWIGKADGFWWGVVAFLKAIVWPVFVIIEVLSRLGL